MSNLCDFITADHYSSLKNVWMLEEKGKDSLVKDEFDTFCDDKSALFGEQNEFVEENKHECTAVGNVICDVNNCCLQSLGEKVALKATLEIGTCVF